MHYFQEVVSARADDIVRKWIDFFVLHKSIKLRTYYREAEMRPSRTAINIVTAEPAGEYRLHLTFDDGMKQTVDFKPFLTHAHHPDIRAYLDPGRFSAFRIEYGELVWGDYDLCFPIIDLYRNQLEHGARKEAAA